MKAINQRILFLRTDLDMSQTEFGERLGVSRGVINNIDRDVTEPKEAFLKLICKTFGVREEWLINGEEPVYESSSRRERIMTFAATLPEDGFKTKLIDLLASLDESQWTALRIYAEKLLENPDNRKDGGKK